MEYFKYLYYFVLVHIVLSVIYQVYIYFIYKTYGVRFKRKSIFFSLVRKEIIENINESADQSSKGALRALLALHTVLSVTGKVILAVIILFAIMLLTELL